MNLALDITASAVVYDVGRSLPRPARVGSQVVGNSGTPDPAWTARFDRSTGWTGADGVYSIPLAENDRLASANSASRTFITFSDTFIGGVNPNGTRNPSSYLINNSTALLSGNDPNSAGLLFNTGPAVGGIATPVFAGNPDGTWYWPIDGAVVGSEMHLFSLRMKPAGGGFGFDYDGIALFSTTITPGNLNNAPPVFSTYTKLDHTGLYVPTASGSSGARVFGQAVMNNTVQGGAYFPDGYIYVYGYRNDALNKKLIVARVPREGLGDPAQYRFWNGSAWTAGAANAQPLAGADRLSSEFSVTPMPDGRYLLVFSYDDAFGTRVAARYANSPTGPWSAPTFLYTYPEADLTPNTFMYGAKAHPALSRPDGLLISYHVNTFEFDEHYQNADIYRPRFITVPLQGAGGAAQVSSGVRRAAAVQPFADQRRIIDELDADHDAPGHPSIAYD